MDLVFFVPAKGGMGMGSGKKEVGLKF